MRCLRKYNVGALFCIALVLCLFSPFSLDCGKSGLSGKLSLNDLPVSTPKDLRVLLVRIVDCSFAPKSNKAVHSGVAIFFHKLRMFLYEDWVSKGTPVGAAVAFAGCPLFLYGRSRSVFTGPASSHGFHLSFSGLSPPPALRV